MTADVKHFSNSGGKNDLFFPPFFVERKNLSAPATGVLNRHREAVGGRSSVITVTGIPGAHAGDFFDTFTVCGNFPGQPIAVPGGKKGVYRALFR